MAHTATPNIHGPARAPVVPLPRSMASKVHESQPIYYIYIRYNLISVGRAFFYIYIYRNKS